MAARTVRISRGRARAVRTAAPPVPGGRFVENRAGWVRARRLFAAFTLALAALYGALLGDALVATPGLASDAAALGIFTATAVLCVAGGAAVTLARAPRGIWWTPEEIIVRDRFTARRSFPRNVPVRVARRYGAGLWAPAPTEIVEVVPVRGRAMTYLVDEGLLTEPST